jgi:hypothetical protein
MPGAHAPGFVVAKGSVHRRSSVVLAHLLEASPTSVAVTAAGREPTPQGHHAWFLGNLLSRHHPCGPNPAGGSLGWGSCHWAEVAAPPLGWPPVGRTAMGQGSSAQHVGSRVAAHSGPHPGPSPGSIRWPGSARESAWPRGIGWNRSQLALFQSMAEKKPPPAWSEAELLMLPRGCADLELLSCGIEAAKFTHGAEGSRHTQDGQGARSGRRRRGSVLKLESRPVGGLRSKFNHAIGVRASAKENILGTLI